MVALKGLNAPAPTEYPSSAEILAPRAISSMTSLHGAEYPGLSILKSTIFNFTKDAMSASGPRERSSRKGQFSCNFCRARKIRCDRPLPCTSCRSRGRTCEFDPTPIAPSNLVASTTRIIRDTSQQQLPLAQIEPLPAAPFHTTSPPQTPNLIQADLLGEIQALRKIVHDLESRVIQNSIGRGSQHHESLSPSASISHGDAATHKCKNQQVGDLMDHLQRVSMSRVTQEPSCVDGMVFKLERIRAIPQAPSLVVQLGKPTTFIWLPYQDETNALVEHYVKSVSHIQHVLHLPSLYTTIDELYRQLDGQEPLKPGHVVLVLSIIANATHTWVSNIETDKETTIFASPNQAHLQTSLWIKATISVLNATQNDTGLSFETIQGIIILAFVVCNIEGVSLRYRSLMATGLLLGRELGLHRIDQKSSAIPTGTLEAESGRRAWWYMVATDWYVFH